MDNIVSYTLNTWGNEQCRHYMNDLEACFQYLADGTSIGRNCEDVRSGLMCYNHKRHVVFYRKKSYGIRIIRILHNRMLIKRHL